MRIDLSSVLSAVILALLLAVPVACNQTGGPEEIETASRPDLPDEEGLEAPVEPPRHEVRRPVADGVTEEPVEDSPFGPSDGQPEEMIERSKEEFVDGLQTQLNKLDQRYAQVRQKAEQSGEEKSEQLREKLAEIEQRRERLRDLLAKLDRETDETTWPQLRQGVWEAWKELELSVDGASSQVRLQLGDDVQIKLNDGELDVQVDEDATTEEDEGPKAPAPAEATGEGEPDKTGSQTQGGETRETGVQEGELPEGEAPESDVPKSDVPKSDIPKSEVPEKEVQEGDVLQESEVPEEVEEELELNEAPSPAVDESATKPRKQPPTKTL